jgi:hypothetical protein
MAAAVTVLAARAAVSPAGRPAGRARRSGWLRAAVMGKSRIMADFLFPGQADVR